jgi:serine/threonine protein kinase
VVALKMVQDTSRSGGECRQRLSREARAAAALDHPNLVPVYEEGQHAGYHYYTMAFVDGETLADKVPEKGLPVSKAVALVRTVAEAVEHVHRHGYIHRDLKPSNILIDRAGRPRVLDFGLAKQYGGGDTHLTLSGQVLGTPSFMAPEQADGGGKEGEEIGPLADVYALGGLLYFTLTGKPPFDGASVSEILIKLVLEAPEPPRSLQPAIPEGLEAICLKCLSKDPCKRYPSAAALAEALLPWAPASHPHGLAETLTPGSAPVQLPRRRRRFPIGWVAAGGVVGLAVAFVCLLLTGVIQLPKIIDPRPDPPSTKTEDGGPPPGDPDDFPEWIRKGLEGSRRTDCTVKVDLVGSVQGDDGERRFEEGQIYSIRIEVAKDAYIGIWSLEREGAVQLFPNAAETDNKVSAGKLRIIPNNEYLPANVQYDIYAEKTDGKEYLRVVAMTRKWALVEGKKEQIFDAFRAPADRDRLLNLFRSSRLRPRNEAAVSELNIPYRVIRRGK